MLSPHGLHSASLKTPLLLFVVLNIVPVVTQTPKINLYLMGLVNLLTFHSLSIILDFPLIFSCCWLRPYPDFPFGNKRTRTFDSFEVVLQTTALTTRPYYLSRVQDFDFYLVYSQSIAPLTHSTTNPTVRIPKKAITIK